jgi:hypothetical protein
MKLHGYCLRCHRARRVTVKLPPAGRVVPIGICDECQEEEDDRAFSITRHDIERCPEHRLDARHYHRNGTCRCEEERRG